MMFEITATRHFSAAHRLRLNDGSLEPLHGHNWTLTVTVGAEKLDPIGVVMDFHDLERRVDQILVPLHNRHLNETAAFADLNPSAENVALHVARALALPPGIRLISVQVWETDGNSAVYRA
jgi:6-pyruvoyltetrahydropterin/6-carboxytetrahydropterin synthase